MAWTLWRGWVAQAARRRVAGLLVITLAAGCGGGFSMLAILGAQRADSSWDRLRTETRAQDILLGVGSVDDATALADEFAATPDVVSTTALNVGGLFAETSPGKVTAGQILIGLDNGFGDEIYRPAVIDGRRPRSADEMLANRGFLDRSGLTVGDSVAVRIADGPDSDVGASTTVTIVGEERGPIDETFTAGTPLLIGHPDLWERWAPTITAMPDSAYAVMVRLVDGVDADEFLDRPAIGELTTDAVEVVTAAEQRLLVGDAIRMQAVAFVLIGLVSAVVATAGIALLITLEVRNLLDEHRTVGSLGAERRSISAAATVPFVVVGTAGALIAVVGAALASRWVPTGLPRRLEPRPGVWIAPWTLALGGLAVIITCALAAFASAHLVQRTRLARHSSQRITTTVAGWFGNSPSIGVGIAAAGGGYHRSAAGPARITMVAAVVATTLVTGVSLIHQSEYQVAARPELAGYPLDLEVGGYDPEAWPTTVDLLDGSDDVGALTITEVGSVSVDGRVRQAAGYRSLRGMPLFTVLDGRLPATPDEIAVGTRSALAIGSTHEIESTSSRRVTVVGRVILNLGDGADDAEFLADLDTLHAIGTEALSRTALVTLSDPATAAAAREELADVVHRRTETPFVCGDDVAERYLPVLQADPPDDEPCLPVVGSAMYNSIDLLPLTRAMAIFLAIVGAAVTVQGLLLLGRRRRREVAVLRSLGFDRRQVFTSSMWLGLTIAVAATLVGAGLGLALGRASASWVAEATGVLPPPEVPWTMLGVVGVGVVATCLLGSLPPGLGALRRTPGEELRAE